MISYENIGIFTEYIDINSIFEKINQEISKFNEWLINTLTQFKDNKIIQLLTESLFIFNKQNKNLLDITEFNSTKNLYDLDLEKNIISQS